MNRLTKIQIRRADYKTEKCDTSEGMENVLCLGFSRGLEESE